MSDEISGFVVTLESDIHEEEAEAIRALLMHIKGVAAVTPESKDVIQLQIGEARAYTRMRAAILPALYRK